MAIGAISTDYIYQSDAPGIQQSAVSAQPDFFEMLASTSHSGGKVNLDDIFEVAGLRYNISPNLLKAVAKIESGFRPDAKSRAGAMGIMQLMPGTAKSLGVTDPYDPEQSIMGGAKFLRSMLDQFGDLRLALAAYNAGPDNVKKYGGIPPFSETQSYVKQVLDCLDNGDIIAGISAYGGSGGTKASSGSGAMGKAFTEMLLVKIIEMQMNSSKDDEKKVF